MILGKRYIPNLLTSSRVLLTIYLIKYICNNNGQQLVPILITIIIYTTDYLDGKIARNMDTTSRFGEFFDVFADFFYIVSIYIIVMWKCNLPLWFLIVIMYKFFEFIATSSILKSKLKAKKLLVFDIVGRGASIMFYLVPIATYCTYFRSNIIYYNIINLGLICITIMCIISTVARILQIVMISK